MKDIPPATWEILQGVNIFNEDLVLAQSADPMICDSIIELDKNELAYLRKGPRFMARQQTILNEKCLPSRSMRNLSQKQEEKKITAAVQSRTLNNSDRRIKREIKLVSAQAGMIYDKQSRYLDMSKLKVTDYK